MLDESWQLVGAVTFLNPKIAQPTAISGNFTRHIVRVGSFASSNGKISIKPTWYKACNLRQVAGSRLVTTRIVPLNQESIFVFPLVSGSYQLIVVPVPWLPNLRIQIWQYNGDETEELLKEALYL